MTRTWALYSCGHPNIMEDQELQSNKCYFRSVIIKFGKQGLLDINAQFSSIQRRQKFLQATKGEYTAYEKKKGGGKLAPEIYQQLSLLAEVRQAHQTKAPESCS